MKRLIYILSLALSFNTYASNDCGDDLNINCWDCGKTQSDNCTARLDGTKLTITSTNNGQMKDYDYWSNINSPWGTNITSADISGVSYIGAYAFKRATQLTEVQMSSTVKTLGLASFDDTSLKSINLPEGLETIGTYAFSSRMMPATEVIIPNSVTTIEQNAFLATENLKSIVIGNHVTSIGKDAFTEIHEQAVIYCEDTTEGRCADLINTNNQTAIDKLMLFNKGDNDVYYTQDGKIFASISLMAKGKNCATEEVCEAIVVADKNGHPFIVEGKFYASLDDWAKNNNIKKRIYTIEEANVIAGPVNRISIRYR